jgi:peroxiredoxin Q/BCP
MAHLRLIRRAACFALFIAASAFASNLPGPGDPAPDFSLTSQSGSQVSLKDYQGRWVILFFFGDHSSEDVRLLARSLQRDLAKYSSFNAVIVGIGVTSPESNHNWADKDGLNFPLLSDPDQVIAKAYGFNAAGSNSTGDGGLYEFIVAPSGKMKLSPRIVTNDVDGESYHLLACLQYFKDQAASTA